MLLLLACATPDTKDTAAAADACDTVPEGRVTLPADDGVHDEPVEWWYWTGHLQNDAGGWYGFEDVFFLFTQGDARFELANVAVTDVSNQTFAYDAKFGVWDGQTPDEGFAFAMDDWSATGGDGEDTLSYTVGGYDVDLNVSAAKAPVLEHGDGYTDYDFGGYTYYYSRTRMDVEGTLGGHVTGTAWFDHQWGDLVTATETGWDWFALQLDDGREVMLFSVRAGDTPELVGGTLVGADCTTTEIPASDVTITTTATWAREDGCEYPSGWDIAIGDDHYQVDPVLADQELPSRERTYWEGAATVTGSASGRAYVELTGYCQ
jgi:predicted secreted hydrolase